MFVKLFLILINFYDGVGSSPTREQPGLPASSSLIGGFPSPVVVPPAVASPASEIVGQRE